MRQLEERGLGVIKFADAAEAIRVTDPAREDFPRGHVVFYNGYSDAHRIFWLGHSVSSRSFKVLSR